VIITEMMLRSLVRESLILEGPRDQVIFKAIFMAGCPGAGKGTVIEAIFGRGTGTTHQGLRIVNPDQLYEYLLSAADMPLSAPDLPKDDPSLSAYRSAAGKLQHRAGMKMTGGSKGVAPGHVGLDVTSYGYKPGKTSRGPSQIETYIQGRKGLIIDGTARNYEKIEREKQILEELGYDVMMVAVVTPEPVAQERNAKRALDPKKRSIYPGAVRGACNALNLNLGKEWERDPAQPDGLKRDSQGNFIVVQGTNRYRDLFGDNYIEIDNTKPEEEAVTDDDVSVIEGFISSPLSATAQQWVSNALGSSPVSGEEPEELTSDDADQLSALVDKAVGDALGDEEDDDTLGDEEYV